MMMNENLTTEFKREFVDDIKKTVIAFANTSGGTIFVGLNYDGSWAGLADLDTSLRQITNVIRDAIKPDVTMFTICDIVKVDDGQPIIAVTVQRGTARPYYLDGKGIRPEGVFVRQGSSTVPATEAAILKMIKETAGDNYEEARSLNQDLTFDKTAAYFDARKITFNEPQKRSLHLIGQDGMFTNLALLLSEQCQHPIKLAVFEGSRKAVFKDRFEFTGSLLNQLQAAYDYIDRMNRTHAEFRGLNRIDSRDYPEEAIREALLNAIIHRDYAFSGSTLISIFDDRIEFVTIGGLVNGISFEDIMLGVSILRNKNLADIFYRLSLIEAYGTGMPKIRAAYDDCYVKPKIEATGNAFKITLPNVNFQNEPLVLADKMMINNRERDVLELFERDQFITRQTIESALKLSQASTINLIRAMVDKKLLVKNGNGKNTKYQRALGL